MKSIKTLALLCIPFILFGVFVLLTNPYKLPIPLLLVPFLLLGVGTFCAVREVLRLSPLSHRKRTLIAATLTSIILLGILLQSIRQLSVKDFLILIVLLTGTTLYVRRIDI
jgi:hypothetical protein